MEWYEKGQFWDHTKCFTGCHVEMGESYRELTIPWAEPVHKFWLAGWWRWWHYRSWQFGARCAASCPSRFETLSCWRGNRSAGLLAAVGTCSLSRDGSEGFLRLRDGPKKLNNYTFNRHSQQCKSWLALFFFRRVLCWVYRKERGQWLPSLNEKFYQEERDYKRDTERIQVSAIQGVKN